MTYPNEALEDICRQLLDEWELTPEQISNLAADIPGECANMRDNTAEAAWCAQQERLMESGEPDDSAYRRDMIAAGRGHLLGEELVAALQKVNVEMSALIPNPNSVSVEDWPVTNPGDAECLQTAFYAVRDALTDAGRTTWPTA